MKNWKEGRKLVNVVCENCHKTFKKTLSEYKRSEKNNKKHYCSINCNREYRKKVAHNFFKKCQFCNNEFIGDNENSKFCSHKCSASYNNSIRKYKKKIISSTGLQNILDANKKRYNSAEYHKNPNHCKECNAELSFQKRNHVFCSIDCKRKYERKNLNEYQKYYKDCQFKFNLSDYPNEFDFDLIKKYGWYQAKNHGNNLNGISRDHMISIMYGYENNISSDIISHPANCQLMRHNENVSKYKNCSITLDELLMRIKMWNIKYGALTQSA